MELECLGRERGALVMNERGPLLPVSLFMGWDLFPATQSQGSLLALGRVYNGSGCRFVGFYFRPIKVLYY